MINTPTSVGILHSKDFAVSVSIYKRSSDANQCKQNRGCNIRTIFLDISNSGLFRWKLNMVDFHITKQIEASQDSIWNIISDVDREPEFWHGTKSIKNIRKNGKVIEREVVIAFRNSICKEVITLNPKNSVEKKITDGVIIGTKISRSHQLEQTVLELMCNGISA
jgi:hypothetical protein